MFNVAEYTYIRSPSMRESSVENQTGRVRSLPSVREMKETNASFLPQNTGYERVIVGKAGGFLQPAYELSRVPERTAARNRSYLETYFDRKLFTTLLRSVYAVSGAVRASGETNEEYYRQSATRVR